MGKELNLVELLKDASKGQKLYSPIFGECELIEVLEDQVCIDPIITNHDYKEYFFEDGTYYRGCGECLLFPSKDNRDWSTFKVEKEGFKVGNHVKYKKTGNTFFLKEKSQSGEGFWARRIISQDDDNEVFIDKHYFSDYEKVEKFNPEWLKPFDRVLAFDNIHYVWIATLFSHLTEEDEDAYPYVMCDADSYIKCIPYNDETKYLVGTADEEPEFYKI